MNNRLTDKERKHLEIIKKMRCVVCDEKPPTDAHHIRQHRQWICIPLCKDCHQGSHNGIHGRKSIWNVMKMDEMDALNLTIERLINA